MPDFSIYFDMPKALKIYNKYRNHWLACYYTLNGINVIPNVNIGEISDIDWSLLGYPKESVIAVSDIGRSKYNQDKKYKQEYINIIRDTLKPIDIIYFSRSHKNIPDNVYYYNLDYLKRM